MICFLASRFCNGSLPFRRCGHGCHLQLHLRSFLTPSSLSFIASGARISICIWGAGTGTPETGEGKRGTMKPVIQCARRVLRDSGGLMPGFVSDDFHAQQSCTTAAAVGKLRCDDGHLLLHGDEAGQCLDLSFSSSSAGGCNQEGRARRSPTRHGSPLPVSTGKCVAAAVWPPSLLQLALSILQHRHLLFS